MTQSAFELLRPTCVKLSTEPSTRGIEHLESLLQEMDADAVQPLQQYILFPLRLVLRNATKVPTGCCESAIGCISKIFSCTTAKDWAIFSDFFSTLCIFISSKTNVGTVSKQPEELKLSVVVCLTSLLESASPDTLGRLYDVEFLPAVGHAVSILLDLARTERLRELRIAAMRCLQRLAQSQEDGKSSCPAEQVRLCFSSFLPGISVALEKVISGDPKQGQAVTICAIRSWSRIVAMVMRDPFPLSQSEGTSRSEGDAQCPGGSLLVERTPAWCKATAHKLDILIGRIVLLASTSSWKIRLALVDFSKDLLLSCKSTLSSSIPRFLQLLVPLVGDDYEQVAISSRQVLEQFAASGAVLRPGEEGPVDDGKVLVEHLEENLHSLMTSLPRLMRTADDAAKLSTLNLVRGYLKLLGPNIGSLLNSASHLRRLSLALVQVSELDLRDVRIAQEVTSQPDSTAGGMEGVRPSRPWRKNFKHFNDENIHKVIVQVCQLLGQYGNVTQLVDHFLDIFHESTSNRKQAVLILNEVMLGATAAPSDPEGGLASRGGSASRDKSKKTEIEGAVRTLIQEYISPAHWKLPVTPDQSESAATYNGAPHWLVCPRQERENTSLAALNGNVLLISLLLEGIGACAQVLGTGFKLVLMDCLYDVLEKVADGKAVISETAYSTLRQVCLSCGYKTIPELLGANADYLVDAISADMRHVDVSTKAPLVLRVTLQYSDVVMLPLLQTTVNEILLTFDQCHVDLTSTMVDVLQALVAAVVRWFPGSESQKQPQADGEAASYPSPVATATAAPATHETIRDLFLEHLRLKRLAGGDVRDGDVGSDRLYSPPSDRDGRDVEMEDELDEEKALPLHVSTVKEVLVRCQHLMASSHHRLRVKVLDIVQHGLQALQDYRDELLPLIHKLWPALLQRFAESKPLVVCGACRTVCKMADTGGSFVQKRVVRDVWPKLISLLTKESKTSEKTGPSYQHTATCKLQLASMKAAGHLSSRLTIGDRELTAMAWACVPYLSTKQPDILQTTAVDVFEMFGRLAPDAVWLVLNDTYCPGSMVPPHECFQTHKFYGECNPQRMDYSKNIQFLLDHIQTGR